ncbi:MAG: MgtC/SapB family protein [Syntrophomonas sp.]|nr:MgtC/SapB family protein [Syntrophomonas sp.]
MTQYLLRVLLAGIIGLFIGLTSTSADKTLSSRTFSIICMGSALITITSIGFYQNLALPWFGDPGRLPAQVISALGFLGTGLIWVTEDHQVAGISSAASLWITAIMGMIIGVGLHNIVVLGVMFFLFIFWVSHLVEGYKGLSRKK